MKKQMNEIDELKLEITKINSKLIEQDHRTFRVLKHFFFKRNKLAKDDPDRKASAKALFWLIFSSRTILTTGFSIVAILGVYFAFKANILLEMQNKKIDIQNHLSESNRRAILAPELIQVIDSINAIKPNENNKKELPRNLKNKIVFLSHVFKPYRYITNDYDEFNAGNNNSNNVKLDVESIQITYGNRMLNTNDEAKLNPNALSPERGLLLIALINQEITNIRELINEGIDLSFSDMEGLNLKNKDFSYFDLHNSSFKGSKLINAKMIKTNIENSNFKNSTLENIDFRYSNISNSSFYLSRIQDINFSDSKVINVNFENSSFNNITYNQLTNFADSNFLNVNLGLYSSYSVPEEIKKMVEKFSLDSIPMSFNNENPRQNGWDTRASEIKISTAEATYLNYFIRKKGDKSKFIINTVFDLDSRQLVDTELVD